MKASLLLSLLPLAAMAVDNADLGNVMCVGDSLTHGVNSGSWRWAMHKILVDNGIRYNEVGVKTGNDSGGVKPGTVYRGVPFRNVHAAQASAHAREISGRVDGPRFNGTNIENWLGLNTAMTNGKTYTGSVCRADRFYMLIGTNDLLGMHHLGATEEEIRAGAESKYAALLGSRNETGERTGQGAGGAKSDVRRIVDAVFSACPQASFTLFSIPAWTTHNRYNINTPAAHESIAVYNGELQAWVECYNVSHGTSIRYVDINHGLVDVTATVPMTGVSTMFHCPGKDGLHPNAQGDLLIAGSVAKALGFGGRTVGLERKGREAFPYSADSPLSLAAGTARTWQWETAADLSAGFTVEFSLPDGLGNGAEDGWDTGKCLSVQVGNGAVGGTLRICEAYICWGDRILYSADMSGGRPGSAYTVFCGKNPIRIAYVPGDTAAGIPAGFYVWLGDVLIGEACPAVAGAYRGVSVTNGTAGEIPLSPPAMAPKPYAPAPVPD